MVRWKGKWNILWASISAACGTASAYYLQPAIHGNPDASNLIVTVFAVFAGVVMALITAIGDPALMNNGSWRSAENSFKRIDNQLIRQAALFFLYIFVIMIFLATYVLKGEPQTSNVVLTISWLERAYLFLSTTALLISMTLPVTMLKLQRRRLEMEISKRRKEAGIKSPPI